MQLPPVIAIHGVGNHEPGDIKGSLDETFNRAGISAEIAEFNWDSYVDHSAKRVRDGVDLLSTTGESLS